MPAHDPAGAAHTDEAAVMDQLRAQMIDLCGSGRINRLPADVVAEFEQAIAARVRAERDEHWQQRLADLQAEIALIQESHERRVARVRAEERQRLVAEIDAVRVEYEALTVDPLWSGGMQRAVTIILAAGSAVPVATPGVTLTRDALDGGWVAEFTALPGCMSQGETIPEALHSLADAIQETGSAIALTLAEPCELCSAGDHAACSAAREDSYCCCPVPFPGPVVATPTEPGAQPPTCKYGYSHPHPQNACPGWLAEQDGQR